MYKLLLLILLPLGTLQGQSKTSWKVYELFSNANIPLKTSDIQKYLPGYSILKIQTNPKNSSLHAILDNNAKVNGLVFSTPSVRSEQMTHLVIPTPESTPELLSYYIEDRAYRLSSEQKLELLDLISQFSIERILQKAKSLGPPMADASAIWQRKLRKSPTVFSPNKSIDFGKWA